MPRGALPIYGRAIHPAAFTLVELILCIGVIAVLVGLALPLLGRVQAHSRETRDLAQIYQDGAVTTAYMQDHGEIFPVGDPLALRAIRMWTSPLVAGGYLPDARAADPGGYTPGRGVRILQSACMTCEPAIFNPDNALGPAQIPSSSISLAKVRFPSQKGWFLQICTDYYDADSYFCSVQNHPAS